jgi:hypothetical protein
MIKLPKMSNKTSFFLLTIIISLLNNSMFNYEVIFNSSELTLNYSPNDKAITKNSLQLNQQSHSSGNFSFSSEDFLQGSMTNLTLDDQGSLILTKTIRNHSWEEVAVSGPSSRSGASMAFASGSQETILFGGYSGGALNDTWIYNSSTSNWTQMSPSVAPSPRYYHSMVYDSQFDKIVLFGGSNGGGETWVYDPKLNNWTEMNPSVSPSARYFHAMVYDSFSNITILFGGSSGWDETWVYDLQLNNWTKMNPAVSPSESEEHSMVFDSDSNRVILFTDDYTWTYDYITNIWVNMNPNPKPWAFPRRSMIYDSNSKKTLLFAGGVAEILYDRTWIYDYPTNTWTQLTLSPRPDARYDHSMVFDSNSNLGILFGGYGGMGATFGDTWLFNTTLQFLQRGSYESHKFNLDNIYRISGNVTWTPITQLSGTLIQLQLGMSNTSNDDDFIYSNFENYTFTFSNLAKYMKFRVIFESDIMREHTPILNAVILNYFYEKPLPNIQFFNPLPNDTVEGVINISVLVSSPNGIEKVYIYAGGLLVAIDKKFPYEYMWDSNQVSNGLVSLLVIATTVLNVEDSHCIQIYVDNNYETVPTKPRNLSVNIENHFFQLNWVPPENDWGATITHYKVYRGTLTGQYQILGITKNNYYTDNDIMAGITYYYVVSAVNEVGESEVSNEAFSMLPSTTMTTIKPSGTTSETTTTSTETGNGFLWLSAIGLIFWVGCSHRKRKTRKK